MADLISRSNSGETIPSDGPITIALKDKVLLSQDQQCRGSLGTDTE